MELTAQKGRGYVSAEHIGGYREVAGSIPLDAMFSPVVSVSYQVEDTRVGQRTDYDRLILDINTNGSIDAREALLKAAQILAGHVGIFTSLAEGEEEEGERLRHDLNQQGARTGSLSDLSFPR